MKPFRTSVVIGMLGCLALAFLAGCPTQTGGGGGGDGSGDGGNGGGGGGGPIEGGFDERGLSAPTGLPAGTDNLPPTGNVTLPIADDELAPGSIVFGWEASDANDTNLDSTVFVSTEEGVFDNPLVTQGIRSSPDEAMHRLEIQLPEVGSYFWGVQITDGVNTIRRPADGVGIPFEISLTGSVRGGLDDVFLLCPRSSPTARSVTTFQWSLGAAVPVRTQLFVSRAGVENPFDNPLRVFEVTPPGSERFALDSANSLPLGDELSWGLRIETVDEALFTFEGQLGEFFLVADNVPPSGELSGPANDSVVPDGALLAIEFSADAGNCEDELTLNIALQQIGSGESSGVPFESDFEFMVSGDSIEADLAQQLQELELPGGRYAWGVLADDGTDQTALPDADDTSRTFRTFIRDTSPRFVDAPAVGTETCPGTSLTDDAIAFSYEDDNGADTVTTTITFAASSSALFDSPSASETLDLGGSGTTAEGLVFLQALDGGGCVAFLNGPGFYGLELDDGVNDPVRATLQYAGELTGACCAPNGTCVESIESECSGTYVGDNSTCDTADCPVLPGACCQSDGSCIETDSSSCSGTFQGEGVSCSSVFCPQPAVPGACCLGDNECVVVFAFECTSGSYQGDGTSCSLCLPPDCNSNGIPDDQDISMGSSDDCNFNGIPDECEDSPIGVEAGSLFTDSSVTDGDYNSLPNENDLNGSICPPGSTVPVPVEWTIISAAPGTNVSIINPTSLNTPYVISPGSPGSYTFQLCIVGTTTCDTVTLTLTEPL